MASSISVSLLFLICIWSHGASAFAPSACRQIQLQGLGMNIRLTNTPLRNSKQDEIAELEERLRKLKEETAEDDSAAVTANGAGSEAPPAPVPAVEIEEPFEEMLSEKWKESDVESEEGGGVMKNLIGGVIFIIAAVAFSQIPVGQEGLDKYSTAKPSTTIDLGDLNPQKKSYDY